MEALASFLGHGPIHDKAARVPHHQPLSELTISSMRARRDATIPFANTYLLPCHKRRQFESWLAAIAEHEAKRVRPCTVEGCDEPRRAHRLCRHHLFVSRGV